MVLLTKELALSYRSHLKKNDQEERVEFGTNGPRRLTYLESMLNSLKLKNEQNGVEKLVESYSHCEQLIPESFDQPTQQ